MKFIIYGVRKDEEGYAQNWSKENNVSVKLVTDLLNKKTVKLAKGYDAIIAYQQLPYDKEIFTSMKEYGIKDLSIRNVGVDNIPTDVAKANGVRITNVPSYSPNAIAELAITGLMQLLRRTPEFNEKMAKGDLTWEPDIAHELHTMTVGVVGTGRIGRAGINIYRGFGAKVLGYDIFRNPDLDAQGIYVDSADELFAKSDIITLHAPATKENYHMINKDSIAKMKDGVYIINTARGDLVNSKDLLAGYKSGKVAGAVLDVYENEVGIFNNDFTGKQIPDPTLRELMAQRDILVTPHVAFYTRPAVRNMVDVALNSAKDMVEKGESQNEVKF
ncbi:D-2-hydroxyacid dehydrogenase [Loigolactobacillus rennini]|uniref:D-lactate dehydrogenase n=2 Tax=Loigolactobacillus rennini TaxID=238013 RepID=A0A0R2D7U7_9LACO|nr:D-2-hydroxyacid dehydrogenase [Loigolactobacillus rennini]KRN00128.1 D-lactate dehydrogenase [Loigolactobacillus rennini DSM 20253]SFZ87969.1 D-lactate dehydrogenase [Loigolactobacillus rennini]